jgi:hypothetical protein
MGLDGVALPGEPSNVNLVFQGPRTVIVKTHR